MKLLETFMKIKICLSDNKCVFSYNNIKTQI